MFTTLLQGKDTAHNTTSANLDSALDAMHAFRGMNVSGHTMDTLTGEVLAIMENGMITSMSTEVVITAIRAQYDKSPEDAHVTRAMGVGALMHSEDAINIQTADALRDLHVELFGAPLSDVDILAGAMTIALMAMLDG